MTPGFFQSSKILLLSMSILLLWVQGGLAGDQTVLRPRVPADQIQQVKTWTNPIPNTPENIEKGKKVFHGKAFCVTCHGRDGKGLGNIPGLRGKTPQKFYG